MYSFSPKDASLPEVATSTLKIPAGSQTAVATRPRYEVADIFRLYGDDFRRQYPVSYQQHLVMRDIVQCRTAALGGHVDACDGCGGLRVSYNSCRNRHCPKCGAP